MHSRTCQQWIRIGSWALLGSLALCTLAVTPDFEYHEENPVSQESSEHRHSIKSITVNGETFDVQNIKGIVKHLRKQGVDLPLKCDSHPKHAAGRQKRSPFGGNRIHMDFPPLPTKKSRTVAKPAAKGSKAQAHGGNEKSTAKGTKAQSHGGNGKTAAKGTHAPAQAGRGVSAVIPRIDFQTKTEDDTKGRSISVYKGRSAGNVIPRIDFQTKTEEDTKGRSAGAYTGRGVSGVIPRIDFQTKMEEEDSKGRSAGAYTGRGVSQVIPRIDFQTKTEEDTKGRSAGIYTGRKVSEIIPRIDFQERSEATAGRSVEKYHGMSKESMPQAGRGIMKGPEPTPEPEGGGFDGEIRIKFKNSKVAEISMGTDIVQAINDGTLKMNNKKDENGQTIFEIDTGEAGKEQEKYKMGDLHVNANKDMGEGNDDSHPPPPDEEGSDWGRSIGGGAHSVVTEADLELDKLPAMVVIRNNPGEEPLFYGRIEREGDHRVLHMASPEEVKESKLSVYELHPSVLGSGSPSRK